MKTSKITLMGLILSLFLIGCFTTDSDDKSNETLLKARLVLKWKWPHPFMISNWSEKENINALGVFVPQKLTAGLWLTILSWPYSVFFVFRYFVV